MRILRDLYYHKPASKRTKLSVAMDHLMGVMKKKGHIFILSDFMDPNFEQSLHRLGRKHDTVAVVIEDKLEKQVPRIGLVDFEDPETGEIACVDTSSPVFQREYAAYLQKIELERQAKLRRSQVDTVTIRGDEDLVTPLLKFFQRRNRR
jgi:uncharacterized protein (DUF58 family)